MAGEQDNVQDMITVPDPREQQDAVMSQISQELDGRSRFPLGSILLGMLCLTYLINPTLGFWELIPDNLPIIGNFDEGVATVGLLAALRNMGIDLFGLLDVKK